MELAALGRLVAERRRAQGLTLRDLAAAARVGRSTLAALESGTMAELGFVKINRICAALHLIIEIRPPLLEAPLMMHRHLTEQAGRELTKAAIEDIIVRGEIDAWRGLVKTMRNDPTGGVARRAREVAAALDSQDEKAHAFATLLPGLLESSDDRSDAT